jgi:hypothetical protein
MANCNSCIITEGFNDPDPFHYYSFKVRRHHTDGYLILGMSNPVVVHDKEIVDLIWNYFKSTQKADIILYNLLTSENAVKVQLGINIIKSLNGIQN